MHMVPKVPAGHSVLQSLPMKPGLQIDDLHLQIFLHSADMLPG